MLAWMDPWKERSIEGILKVEASSVLTRPDGLLLQNILNLKTLLIESKMKRAS